MPVTRLIYCAFPAEEAEKAIENWKEHCAPLMIQQEGCRSERLLESTENAGEMISYSEWDDQASIDRYLQSDAHKEIKRQNRNIEGAEVSIKLYQTVG